MSKRDPITKTVGITSEKPFRMHNLLCGCLSEGLQNCKSTLTFVAVPYVMTCMPYLFVISMRLSKYHSNDMLKVTVNHEHDISKQHIAFRS